METSVQRLLRGYEGMPQQVKRVVLECRHQKRRTGVTQRGHEVQKWPLQPPLGDSTLQQHPLCLPHPHCHRVPSRPNISPHEVSVWETQLAAQHVLYQQMRYVWAPLTSTVAMNVLPISSSNAMLYRKLASSADLLDIDLHMLSGITPDSHSLLLIPPIRTIHTSFTCVTTQHRGLQLPGCRWSPFLYKA